MIENSAALHKVQSFANMECTFITGVELLIKVKKHEISYANLCCRFRSDDEDK